MKSLLVLALLVASPCRAADPSPEGSVFNSITGRISHFIDGYIRMGNSTGSPTPPVTVTIDGPNGEGVFIGSVTASNITTDESVISTLGVSTNSFTVWKGTTSLWMNHVQTTTLTVTGQDPSGYSIGLASGVNAGNGCILLQGGNVCGPTPGPTGPTGATGLAGRLTFASDIASFWIITSTSQLKNYALTVATDGALVITSTTTTAYSLGYQNVNKKYLSNGVYTSLLTVDDSDGVLRLKKNHVSLMFTDLAIYDTGGVVWDIGLDSDGVVRTTNMGSL